VRPSGCAGLHLDAEAVEVEMDWAESLCTAGGLMHGGALMALADAAGGACAFANLPGGAVGTATIESKTNFLGAVRDGTVRAVSTPLHVGSSTIVVETELRASDGRLVAKTTQTQTVLRPR
jgi:1,4-dihydroxy-2-naphthoyl-CoA hydrolase